MIPGQPMAQMPSSFSPSSPAGNGQFNMQQGAQNYQNLLSQPPAGAGPPQGAQMSPQMQNMMAFINHPAVQQMFQQMPMQNFQMPQQPSFQPMQQPAPSQQPSIMSGQAPQMPQPQTQSQIPNGVLGPPPQYSPPSFNVANANAMSRVGQNGQSSSTTSSAPDMSFMGLANSLNSSYDNNLTVGGGLGTQLNQVSNIFGQPQNPQFKQAT